MNIIAKTQFEQTKTQANEFSVNRIHRFDSLGADSKTILLISDDRDLYENLRLLANEGGLMVVKMDGAAGIVEVLQVLRPSAVLVDLDLPHEAAWKSADILLNETDCPAVILVTGRTGHMDMQSAMHAGLVVNKGDSPDRLLRIIEEALEMPGADQPQRNALRRELIRWLRPSGWETGSASPYRFWGINE